jgi:hypothetical protein
MRVEPATLPEILETKVTLSGGRKEFRCRVLERREEPGGRALVVLFVSDGPYQVEEIALPAGTITFGHFWATRPYNVYHWLEPTGATIARYANLADGAAIGEDTLTWRDLTVDVLLRPGAPAQVLDEAELPADLAPADRAALDRALLVLRADLPALLPALEERADRLWARLHGGRRR